MNLVDQNFSHRQQGDVSFRNIKQRNVKRNIFWTIQNAVVFDKNFQ